MDGETFAYELLETNDLDPVYVLVWESEMDNAKLCKWLVAYWCLYSVGAACLLSESNDFWNDLLNGCNGTNLPRGTERRHFRGDIAINSVKYLRKEAANNNPYGPRGTPEHLLDSLYTNDVVRLPDLISKISKWNGFGPWISFKVADMLERLNLQKMTSLPEDVFVMFDSPVEGAKIYAQKYGRDVKNPSEWAYNYLFNRLSEYLAPPTYNRIINIQEIETVLCKFKSHSKGKYEVGHDIKEVRQSLLSFGRCKTSQLFLKAGKKGELW